LHVDVYPDHARYELLDGEPLDVLHCGETVSLTAGSPQTRPVVIPPEPPPVAPPPGRTAVRHGVGADDSKPGMTRTHPHP
jgi:alpha,alpha-trehalose phosphorylase